MKCVTPPRGARGICTATTTAPPSPSRLPWCSPEPAPPSCRGLRSTPRRDRRRQRRSGRADRRTPRCRFAPSPPPRDTSGSSRLRCGQRGRRRGGVPDRRRRRRRLLRDEATSASYRRPSGRRVEGHALVRADTLFRGLRDFVIHKSRASIICIDCRFFYWKYFGQSKEKKKQRERLRVPSPYASTHPRHPARTSVRTGAPRASYTSLCVESGPNTPSS